MRRRGAIVLLAGAVAGCAACAPVAAPPSAAAKANPPAPGFDAKGSDPGAVQVADALMQRLGGRGAWDRTRYLTWEMPTRRRYLWDRYAGRVRLERAGPRSGRPWVIVLDLNGAAGRAWQKGQEITDDGELAPLLGTVRREWVGDCWWLTMPCRLKDNGVTLRLLGEGATAEGRAADLLELTFTTAGVAPEAKYHVWVARESGLVEQWSGFVERDSPEPAYTCPWREWKRYGGILLCGDHGELDGRPVVLSRIAVLDEVPDAAFEAGEALDWDALLQGSQRESRK